MDTQIVKKHIELLLISNYIPKIPEAKIKKNTFEVHF